MTDQLDRKLGSGEGTVQAQSATQELRCDGADNALPKFDMNTARLQTEEVH